MTYNLMQIRKKICVLMSNHIYTKKVLDAVLFNCMRYHNFRVESLGVINITE